MNQLTPYLENKTSSRSLIKARHEQKKKGLTKKKAKYEEIVSFLRQLGEENPEATIESLYAVYNKLEASSEFLKPYEKEYFYLKTEEKFLNCFVALFDILLRANKRLKDHRTFDEFWGKCMNYLEKVKMNNLRGSLLKSDNRFKKISMNYWINNYDADPKALTKMLWAWRACFGVIGNDNYCQIKSSNEPIFDWDKMNECRIGWYGS